MSSPILERLSHELLMLIVGFVAADSPDTIPSIAVVNRSFYSATEFIVHRNKTIVLEQDSAKAEKKLQRWMSDEKLLRGLRHLTVKADARYRSSSSDCSLANGTLPSSLTTSKAEQQWESLALLLQSLGHLATLSWQCHEPMPLILLQALEQFQKKAELHIHFWERFHDTTDHTDPAEIALAKSPALTQIRASIWTLGAGSHPDLRQDALLRIVGCAPNLKQVSIDSGRAGCIVRGFRLEELQNLHALGKPFYSEVRPSRSIRRLSLSSFELRRRQLQRWSYLIDLSCVESLRVTRFLPDEQFFSDASTQLTNLKHLALNLYPNTDSSTVRAAVIRYFSNCNPLHSLSLCNWSWVLPLAVILGRHGATLKKLQLRQSKEPSTRERTSRHFLTVDEVKAIKTACPHLRDLTICLSRQSTEPTPDDYQPILELLSSMNLDRLQLHCDLGLAFMYEGRPQISYPVSTKCGTVDIFESSCFPPSEYGNRESLIRGFWERVFRHSTTGSRILDIIVGNWEQGYGLHRYERWASAEYSERSFWRAMPHERDDRPGQCRIVQISHGEPFLDF